MTKPQPDTSLDDALTLTEPCFLLIEDINADAFLRDRTQLDDETIHELMLSITLHSLRTPIEVVELEGTPPWGLISGRRRLEAMKRLGHTKVPAVVRTPEDAAAVLKLVVEENAMREGITPWEQGRFIVTSVRQGYYPSTEEAVNALFNTQTRQKRMRLRALATAFDYFDGRLNDPHSYSEHKLRRLAAAAEAGLDEVMDAALADLRRDASPREQWQVLERLCWEVEQPDKLLRDDKRPGYPRRRVVLRGRNRMNVRRERTRHGWNLVFTGSDVTGSLMEDIMDYVEKWFGDTA